MAHPLWLPPCCQALWVLAPGRTLPSRLSQVDLRNIIFAANVSVKGLGLTNFCYLVRWHLYFWPKVINPSSPRGTKWRWDPAASGCPGMPLLSPAAAYPSHQVSSQKCVKPLNLSAWSGRGCSSHRCADSGSWRPCKIVMNCAKISREVVPGTSLYCSPLYFIFCYKSIYFYSIQ